MMAVAALCSARAKKLFIFRKSQVTGLRVFGGRKIFQDGVAVADDFALQMFRNFSGSKRHCELT